MAQLRPLPLAIQGAVAEEPARDAMAGLTSIGDQRRKLDEAISEGVQAARDAGATCRSSTLSGRPVP
jgi:hypothetical protein